ncbi:MAG: Hpt domain-containing protein [Opitutales bacterium]|jgi:HPt (histidine-containing phosphotransfer) domain-containing protein
MALSDFSDSPLIDREQFDMLVETGEDDASGMLVELLDLFTGEAEPKFLELHQASSDVDRHKCNRIAHALAGASANLGLLRLSMLCRAFEQGSKAEMPREALIKSATDIEALYLISVAEMRVEISKLG